MASKNPATVAAKWRDRLASSTQEMIDGVNAVTQAPGAKAAAKQDQMKARLLEAINSGKWARNVAKQTLGEWQQSMITLAIPRVATGAQEKVGKMEAFLTKFLPYAENVSKTVKAMPNNSDADSKARMLKAFDMMKLFTKS